MKIIKKTEVSSSNEHIVNSGKETLSNAYLLIDTPFVHMLKEYSHNKNTLIAIDKLEDIFREFVGNLYTCFGTDINYPNLYRLAVLTKAELGMLKTKIERIGSGEKCVRCFS